MDDTYNTAIWCVIPVYNHAGTIRNVVTSVHAVHPQVLVVDDGSTDADPAECLAPTGAEVLRHAVNRGKGAALLTAAQELNRRGARWMITLDADGQHDASDLVPMIHLLNAAEDDHFVVIGQRDLSAPHIPRASRFGMRFSDMWVRLETGVSAHDTQSGFRAYPIRHLMRLKLRTARYDFEIEALVRLLWGGLTLRQIPIHVWYPAVKTSRISHFRPFLDNARMSLTHARLVTRCLMPWPYRRLVPATPPPQLPLRDFFLHPLRFLRKLLDMHASPFELSASAAIGVFFGTLPLLMSHTLVIAYVTARLRMNQLMSLSIQSLCAPPVVPVLCIQLGYRLRTGRWLTDLAWVNVPSEYAKRLWEWLIGSIVLAPVLSVLIAALVYLLSTWVARRRRKPKSEPSRPRQRGNAFGIGCFQLLTRCAGLRGAYALLLPVCLYYALFDRSAVRSALPYLRHRFPGHSRGRLRLDTYRLFLEQGKMLIDRYAGLSGSDRLQFELGEGQEQVRRLAGKQGAVLLISHVGNWQAAIPSLTHFCMPVSLIMLHETNPAVHRALKVAQNQADIHVVGADQFLMKVPHIVAALQERQLVGLMGDRAYGAPTVPVSFLGETAYFPYSAFGIAASVGCPILAMFVARTGCGRYAIDTPLLLEPAYRTGIQRQRQLAEWVTHYASALETFARRHPYQCFQFSDLWAKPETAAETRTHRESDSPTKPRFRD